MNEPSFFPVIAIKVHGWLFWSRGVATFSGQARTVGKRISGRFSPGRWWHCCQARAWTPGTLAARWRARDTCHCSHCRRFALSIGGCHHSKIDTFLTSDQIWLHVSIYVFLSLHYQVPNVLRTRLHTLRGDVPSRILLFLLGDLALSERSPAVRKSFQVNSSPIWQYLVWGFFFAILYRFRRYHAFSNAINSWQHEC